MPPSWIPQSESNGDLADQDPSLASLLFPNLSGQVVLSLLKQSNTAMF